jgi:hypothetical protein
MAGTGVKIEMLNIPLELPSGIIDSSTGGITPTVAPVSEYGLSATPTSSQYQSTGYLLLALQFIAESWAHQNRGNPVPNTAQNLSGGGGGQYPFVVL